MQRRVLDRESVVAHRAVNVNDCMAARAGESRLSLRRIYLRLDRFLETPIEKHCMVMTAGAPLAALRRALCVLHVFDGLPVKLVIERAEMMGRCVPFVINLLVALSAGLGIH